MKYVKKNDEFELPEYLCEEKLTYVRYTYWLNLSVPGIIEIHFLNFINALKTFEIFHYANET